MGSESTYHGIKMAFEPKKKPRFLLFLLILTDMDLLLRGVCQKSNVEIISKKIGIHFFPFFGTLCKILHSNFALGVEQGLELSRICVSIVVTILNKEDILYNFLDFSFTKYS